MAKGFKTGGRKKGTPNKENPLKGFLAAHSMRYFEPNEPSEDNPEGLSLFEIDMLRMKADERVTAELKLLKFHTPEMRSTDIDMSISEVTKDIEDRLVELCGDDEDE